MAGLQRRTLFKGTAVVCGVAVLGLALKKWYRAPHPLAGVVLSPLTLPLVANAAGLSPNSALQIPSQGPLVLEFFDSSCGACRQILPSAQHRPLKANAQFVLVSLDETRETALETARAWGLVKPLAWDDGWKAKRQLQIVGIPAVVVVAASGEVTGWFPYNPSDAEVESALEDAAEAATPS